MVFIRKRTQIKLISCKRSASELNIVQSKWAFEVNKMRLAIKSAILFAAVILVLAPTAVTVFAQPSGMGIGKERGHARLFAEPLLIGHGFALQGDQYHVLDVSATKLSNISPSFIRSLLSQNKSPDEIAKEIQNNTQIATRTTAHLRFAGQAYALNVTGYDNQSLTGDVLTLPARGANQTGFTPATVGHISLSISKYEGESLSTGTLTMNGTDYKVLLTSPMRLREW
ncbi:Uncharacterised protein [uncultured archaeon]|nr:Uncharacterised protein [uncultured archaeon]